MPNPTTPGEAASICGAITAFMRESNAIEGIFRDPTPEEIGAAERFMRLFDVSTTALGDFQAIVAPGKPLRESAGMNVRVGDYIAPPGGPIIVRRLQAICRDANRGSDPYETHLRFETLHPYIDGNGRTGRMLWAWQMHGQGRNPFALSFLQRWYYETLSHAPERYTRRLSGKAHGC